MLALIAIFLATLLISAISVWLYRIVSETVSEWKGFNQAVTAHHGPEVRMKLRAQQGYISLISSPSQKARPVRLRGSIGIIKAPWGW